MCEYVKNHPYQFLEPKPLSELMPMTPEVQAILDEVRPIVEKHLERTFTRFVGVDYKTQEVIGLNYFIKVDAGEKRVVHLRVLNDPEDKKFVVSIKHFTDNLDREIVYF